MPGTAYDGWDVDSTALCMWKEARGDGRDAMRAVGHVITNRVGHIGFARTVHDVIYGKNQFTSMSCPRDPEFNLEPKPGDPQYAFCTGIAEQILNGSDQDLTNGAHYYANLAEANSGWFFHNIVNNPSVHPLTATIGHQVFYE